MTASNASSSHSKTRAGPVKTCSSCVIPATFTMAPSGARLPFRPTTPPVFVIGVAIGWITRPSASRSIRSSSSPIAAAGGGHAILVDQARLAQLLHHHRHAAGLVEVLGDELPARLEVDEIGRVAEDVADVVEVEVDPRLVRDGRQVQAGIGRAAGAGDDARGVFQRSAGDDVTGADVLLDQAHHRLAATPRRTGRGSRRAPARRRS